MANDYFYFKNLDIIGMLDDMESNFAKELQKLIEKYGGKLLRNVKQRTPVDTGQLRRSWELEKDDLYVKVFNNTEYGLHVEYGHRIVGRDGKVKGVAEGVYMLKTSFEKTKKNFEEDLENLFKKYGFK
ncbi:HK97 gp10 family phage protein [Clostridium sp.]|jgi:hypothetical protein|uniref:HK97 gp10 family phage protein n=1 Tax=Clostridium sp. TaxID=1506 RepID=UPI0039958A90